MPRYTLVEHENLANFVVAVAVTPKLEARARQHMGVTFDDYAKADTAANETNDWACVQNEDGEPLYPNRVAQSDRILLEVPGRRTPSLHSGFVGVR